jgi:AcrR family transcriptional regulator
MRLTETAPTADHRRHTKDRILDVAERMFAQQGFELTSLRALTAEADVNVAAVHYHFGSKERLFEAVLNRLVGPVNHERLARLDMLEAAGVPSLESLIDAFIGPPLRLGLNRSGTACLLLGRCMSSPDEQMRVLLVRLFGAVLDRFIPAFARALPHLPHPEVLWRMFFMLGVMTQTLSAGQQLAYVSQGACAPDRADESVPRIVEFVAAGMRAPVPGRLS